MSRIIVKNLPKNITEEKLRTIFSEKGNVTGVQLKYSAEGKFKQSAAIEYQNEKEAEQATMFFNNSRIHTKKITVEPCVQLANEAVLKYLKEEEQYAANIPTTLPMYCEILNQDSTYVVNVQDVDRLQEDLERLLCRCANRQRLLRTYIEDNKENKKVSVRTNRKVIRQRKRGSKVTVRKQVPKPSRNRSPDMQLQRCFNLTYDISRRFWEYVNTYCRGVTVDDLAYLDLLINESSQSLEDDDPPKGEHYSLLWDISKSNNYEIIKRKGRKSLAEKRLEMDKQGSPEEQSILIKGKNGRSILKVKNGLCLESAYKVYQNASNFKEPEDFILKEIKKCKSELERVRNSNMDALKRLKDDAMKQMNVKTDETLSKLNHIKREN